MLKVLFLILFLMSSIICAQQTANNVQKEKPKSYIFDEFGKISRTDLQERTKKFKEKLQENRNNKNFNNGFLFFYYEDEISLRKLETSIRDILYEDCRDCFGFNVQITFVKAGKTKNQKTQFWVVPFGSDPPEPIDEKLTKENSN